MNRIQKTFFDLSIVSLSLITCIFVIWVFSGLLSWFADINVYNDNKQSWMRVYKKTPSLSGTFNEKIEFLKTLKLIGEK